MCPEPVGIRGYPQQLIAEAQIHFFYIFLLLIRVFRDLLILSIQNWYIWVLCCLLGVSREVVHARNQQIYAKKCVQSTVFGRFWPILTVFDVSLYWRSSQGYTWRLPIPMSAGTWPLAGWVKGHAQNTPRLLLAFTICNWDLWEAGQDRVYHEAHRCNWGQSVEASSLSKSCLS